MKQLGDYIKKYYKSKSAFARARDTSRQHINYMINSDYCVDDEEKDVYSHRFKLPELPERKNNE